MEVYIDLVVILNFLVDFLLLLGAERLCGYPPRWGRTAIAAGAGGIYAGAVLLPPVQFLGNTLWRIVSLLVISWLAFGISRSALRRCVVFVLLSMALGGIAVSMNSTGFGGIAMAAVGIVVMCGVGFRGRIGGVSYIPVELTYRGKKLHLTALQDTGNALRDPVTGNPVLVIGADAATQLTGLSRQQLQRPVESITSANLPGLCLIPYHTVGQPAGLLLALKIQNVKIGKWEGSYLVAFAPEGLSKEGAYQALTGGAA